MDFSIDQFERDVAARTMRVIRDDGVDRHLRFARPGTMRMHFDLLTWPGYLCFTGDMGTYVFWRDAPCWLRQDRCLRNPGNRVPRQ